jgi:hypothetical protein
MATGMAEATRWAVCSIPPPDPACLGLTSARVSATLGLIAIPPPTPATRKAGARLRPTLTAVVGLALVIVGPVAIDLLVPHLTGVEEGHRSSDEADGERAPTRRVGRTPPPRSQRSRESHSR